MPQAEIVIELGRYLVGEAGIYVCKVIDRKVSAATVYLVTDGGLHHHLAASGNFGQVIRKNYPVAIGTAWTSPPPKPCRRSVRCARRSTCSPTRWRPAVPGPAIWSSCSSPAPTARPPACARFPQPARPRRGAGLRTGA